ncbi:bifunctional riboflavin kinase/FAD synthetase [soil metagenome]
MSNPPLHPPAQPRTVVTVGVLDGVHRGHAAVIQRAADLARELSAPRILALVFDPHPASVLNPAAAAPPRLSSFTQRARWLRAAGATEVQALVPTPALLARDPADFLTWLKAEFNIVGIVEGADFRFGARRAGDMELLHWLAPRLSIAVRTVEPVDATLLDHTIVPARSSIIRWLLAQGRVADAALILGRPFEIEGTVEPGDRRGRTLGFPTANLATAHALPAFGVYACDAVLPDGSVFPAAVNVGPRPTIAGAKPTLEAHLIIAPTPAPASVPAAPWAPLPNLPEYGWPITLRFQRWLRDQIKFDSLAALQAQLVRDRQRAGLGWAVQTPLHRAKVSIQT